MTASERAAKIRKTKSESPRRPDSLGSLFESSGSGSGFESLVETAVAVASSRFESLVEVPCEDISLVETACEDSQPPVPSSPVRDSKPLGAVSQDLLDMLMDAPGHGDSQDLLRDSQDLLRDSPSPEASTPSVLAFTPSLLASTPPIPALSVPAHSPGSALYRPTQHAKTPEEQSALQSADALMAELFSAPEQPSEHPQSGHEQKRQSPAQHQRTRMSPKEQKNLSTAMKTLADLFPEDGTIRNKYCN